MVLPPILGYLVTTLCFFYLWAADFAVFGESEGLVRRTVDVITRLAGCVTLVSWFVIPVAMLLWVEARSSRPEARRLRRWAAVVGIITCGLIVLDVLAAVAATRLVRNG
jgi:hypothetical protein